MKPILSLLLFLTPLLLSAQVALFDVRICTYNVLNYSKNTPAHRSASLRTVLREVRPAVLVLNEIAGQEGVTAFAQQVIDSLSGGKIQYDLAEFTDGQDSDNALFYDRNSVKVLSHKVITTALRNIDVWTISHYWGGGELTIFACHLKAGDDSASAAQRFDEAIAIRGEFSAIPEFQPYIVAGDLNVYDSDDQAYQALVQEGKFTKNVVDPIERPGKWHSNKDFADIHTQSTRVRQFEGGIGGGLDDRFDFILVSPNSLHNYPNYIHGSYSVFGNDGKHLNDSINAMPNAAVSPEIAQALYDASDHLPVYADFYFAGSGAVDDEENSTGITVAVTPLPIHDRATFTITSDHRDHIQLTIIDINGKEVAQVMDSDVEAGTHEIEWDAGGSPAGIYVYKLASAQGKRTGKIVVVR